MMDISNATFVSTVMILNRMKDRGVKHKAKKNSENGWLVLSSTLHRSDQNGHIMYEGM